MLQSKHNKSAAYDSWVGGIAAVYQTSGAIHCAVPHCLTRTKTEIRYLQNFILPTFIRYACKLSCKTFFRGRVPKNVMGEWSLVRQIKLLDIRPLIDASHLMIKFHLNYCGTSRAG